METSDRLKNEPFCETQMTEIDETRIENENDPEHPINLIPELCRLFYSLGWVTGTGGGISIKREEKFYLAPSGVQKERMQPSHLYILDKKKNILSSPDKALGIQYLVSCFTQDSEFYSILKRSSFSVIILIRFNFF